MERLTRTDNVNALATALAHDFNDELTVILSSVSSSILRLEPGHPARPCLLEAQRAAERCAGKTLGVLAYSARRGASPTHWGLETILDFD